MKKFFTTKRIVIILLVIISLIQFIPIEKNNLQGIADTDFFLHAQASIEIESLIKRACYDCHSESTNYPGYASVAPLSMWIEWHIEEGKEHLNFSNWANLSADKKRHAMEECVEMIEEEEMPLSIYTLMHSEAELSKKDRDNLIEYFKSFN